MRQNIVNILGVYNFAKRQNKLWLKKGFEIPFLENTHFETYTSKSMLLRGKTLMNEFVWKRLTFKRTLWENTEFETSKWNKLILVLKRHCIYLVLNIVLALTRPTIDPNSHIYIISLFSCTI